MSVCCEGSHKPVKIMVLIYIEASFRSHRFLTILREGNTSCFLPNYRFPFPCNINTGDQSRGYVYIEPIGIYDVLEAKILRSLYTSVYPT